MSVKAFESGLKRNNTNGRLEKFFDELWNDREIANNVRLYGETVFIYSNHSLVTVWQLPIELRPLAKVIRVKLVPKFLLSHSILNIVWMCGIHKCSLLRLGYIGGHKQKSGYE
ncbi:MAG: hypothetical protein M3Z56_05095 [Bacteroidota bacterium]|nr:hypothetical protein [Bacteroidota bacterium]